MQEPRQRFALPATQHKLHAPAILERQGWDLAQWMHATRVAQLQINEHAHAGCCPAAARLCAAAMRHTSLCSAVHSNGDSIRASSETSCMTTAGLAAATTWLCRCSATACLARQRPGLGTGCVRVLQLQQQACPLRLLLVHGGPGSGAPHLPAAHLLARVYCRLVCGCRLALCALNACLCLQVRAITRVSAFSAALPCKRSHGRRTPHGLPPGGCGSPR